ncbi:HPr kinase [Kineosporia sp. NBRC 101677]|uniref:3-oxo-tetronate kinase n=1 Tax=Kineosporia sp. NBRC 101677 TaxID=3032197 RepID=UPI0024A1521E|nr:3-oxo-tetronate kinase [Kineosporia sp. NBRC 101677]GLY17086.1 HPr kinase [Kineosporia sp. NBRC 101677]
MIGLVADDFTGATDVAAGLRRVGLRTALVFDVPAAEMVLPECDAIVIGLKTRTVPAAEAVAQSLAAAGWLREQGVQQYYFKYCSTFDSTAQGNIGPVADALLEFTGSPVTFVTPASPEHGRTVYQGHLFVGDVLLSDSPMRHHPLTPMTDPDIRAVLATQTGLKVGHLPLPVVRAGEEAVRAAVQQAQDEGVRYLVTDVVQDEDLDVLARAGQHLTLHTGGAGLGRALGNVLLGREAGQSESELPLGPGLALAGSCSAATLRQVAYARKRMPSHRIDPVATPDAEQLRRDALEWLHKHQDDEYVLIYSSAPAEERGDNPLGPDTANVLESILATVARAAAEAGRARIVVAGGETSGAVVQALGVQAAVVASEADTGVPWILPVDGENPALLLKSGNFGRDDLLVRGQEGTRR